MYILYNIVVISKAGEQFNNYDNFKDTSNLVLLDSL